MLLSTDFKTLAMMTVVDSYLYKFQIALGLSARRGRFKGDVPRLFARLAMFKRSGSTDFNEWDALTTEAGRTFDEWYDWYEREYSTPLEPLFNFTIDEFRALGGLSGIEEILSNSPAAGKDAA